MLFFIPTLESGGAERVCLHYVNKLRHYRPVLALQQVRGPLLREVAADVRLVGIFDAEAVGHKPPRSSWFRGRFEQVMQMVKGSPSVALSRAKAPCYVYSTLWQARRLSLLARRNSCPAAVSFITLPNVITIIAKVFFQRRLKVVINVHDVTSRILQESGLESYERILLKWLVRRLYPKADLIVAVAEGIKRDLVDYFGIPAEKIAVINNPIDIRWIRVQAAEPVTHPWLSSKEGPLVVAVGRLVKLKGYDLLIQAFARLPHRLNARLIVVGEGAERPRLEQLIEQQGLKDRAELLGFQENPWKYMARADMLVLSSLTEGLPNAIGEAMALGLPVLATDCSPGVREYLQDGEDGLLVPPGNIAALADGMERLITDRELRARLAQRAGRRIEAFDLQRIVQVYEEALARVISV